MRSAQSELQDVIVRLRSAYSGFRQGNIIGLLDGLDPDIRWDASEALLHTGTFHGHTGVTDYIRGFAEHWDDFMLEASDFIAHEPDTITVDGILMGREKSTGRVITAQFTHRLRVVDGRVVELRVVVHRDESAAAGHRAQATARRASATA
ncbi:MAG TPA: nuclear transport factor 2 family protein [Solirubrobacteraceae bacterium]|jgi:ketosteroid isomerase-like protein|nr:nuclear transport factor 2 family protein [Solirubrobacteraceae bacterium]